MAAARIRPGDPARRQIVLEACSVDEHVHVVRWQRAAGKRLEGVVQAVVQDGGPRRERNQTEEIAIGQREVLEDRKSTRLNSSHGYISYAVFCLKKKKNRRQEQTHRNETQRLS